MVSDEQTKEIQDTEDRQDETTASPGRLLKAGREKQRLSQQQVADKLFLKVEQIDDLENDRIDEKTSVTFTRGYIRNYAKQLGLSQEEVIAEFDRLHTAHKQPARLQSFSRRVAKQNHDDRWMMVTYAIVILLLAGVVVWWYQQSDTQALVTDTPANDEAEQSQTADLAGTQPDTNVTFGSDTASPDSPVTQRNGAAQDRTPTDNERDSAASTGSLTDPVASESQTSESQTSDPQTVASQTVESQTVESQTNGTQTAGSGTDQGVDQQPESTVNAAPSSATQAQQPENGAAETLSAPIEMVFRFADDCWVNIEDGTGEAIAYGIKQAGRVMEISGVPPVEVTLGAPDNVAITVNGEAVDMSVYPGGRTARFSLPIQD